MAFINRTKELKALEKHMNSSKAELIIVYGKRRVGKTELLKQLDVIYILFRQESEKNQLSRISETFSTHIKDLFLQSNPFKDWDAFFTYIRDKNLKIVFDEFPYAVGTNSSLPSILQDHWDNYLNKSKIKLILCGSSISMMESLLGYKSPLYGRRTSQFLLEPMAFKEASLFYKNLNPEEKIEMYSILGGTPAYILEFDCKKSIKNNINEKILQRDAFLFNEVNFILREELKEPRTYFSILSALALGKTKLSEIINYTGYDKGTCTRYLDILQDLHLIKRIVPITEKSKEKSRKGRHIISDNFFRFWFKYIFQNLEYIQQDRETIVLAKIMNDLNQYISINFEEICRDFLKKKDEYSLVGSWWEREDEIDIVALNEGNNQILLGECKWSNNLMDADIYATLKKKAENVKWKENQKKTFTLFSKNGFTEKMKEIAIKENVLLYTLKDLIK